MEEEAWEEAEPGCLDRIRAEVELDLGGGECRGVVSRDGMMGAYALCFLYLSEVQVNRRTG